MNIEIENCNNINYAKICIKENKLNIKLAPNGTGKSTIAKSILLNAKDEATLIAELLPFKFRGSNPEDKKPIINGIGKNQNVMCFNEEYVSQFSFQKNELLNNSFEILIRTDSYKIIEQEIEDLVSGIKIIFANNQKLEDLISTLKELGDAFKLTKSGISKSSTGVKGLSGGDKTKHIPEGLESYAPFIQSQNSVSWIGWQTEGCSFSNISDCCPFCASSIINKKEQIEKVSQEYDKNTIKNLLRIKIVIEQLGEYFSEKAKEKLSAITDLENGFEKEHESFIINIKTQIDDFVAKLEKIKSLSGFHFEKGDNVSQKLSSYKINFDYFSELDSPKTQEAVKPINESIEKVIGKAGLLQGRVNVQQIEIQNLIQKHQNSINDFLMYAGYKYKVEIVGEDSETKLKLLHIDHNEHLSGGNQYLSYGERNAFAIVLFMYDCLSKCPDVIILDDPISSFDNNKKYAILEMLFLRDSADSFKNKTVLMLTHDVEPIIDTMKSLSNRFKGLTFTTFLKLSKGRIDEEEITKKDIKTFPQICQTVFDSDKDEIIKLIYLRRHYEILNETSDAYQVLSNLLHKRIIPLDKREHQNEHKKYPEMENTKFDIGCKEIMMCFPDFSYPLVIEKLTDIQELKLIYNSCQNRYEKLQVFRFFDIEDQNSVMRKFTNETYHIENEYICQLDPAKFDTIPEYVIENCDELLSKYNN